jgi:hypothetical protein
MSAMGILQQSQTGKRSGDQTAGVGILMLNPTAAIRLILSLAVGAVALVYVIPD